MWEKLQELGISVLETSCILTVSLFIPVKHTSWSEWVSGSVAQNFTNVNKTMVLVSILYQWLTSKKITTSIVLGLADISHNTDQKFISQPFTQRE